MGKVEQYTLREMLFPLPEDGHLLIVWAVASGRSTDPYGHGVVVMSKRGGE